MQNPLEMDEAEFVQLKAVHFSHPTVALYTHIGFFITWFGITEMHITRLLALALDMQDLPKFDLLTKGMDARVKCERLRKACKAHQPAGPLFLAYLTRFEQTSSNIRNQIAHSWPYEHDEHIYFTSIRTGPLNLKAMQQDGTSKILVSDLIKEGLWLSRYSNMLTKATSVPLRPPGGLLELVE